MNTTSDVRVWTDEEKKIRLSFTTSEKTVTLVFSRRKAEEIVEKLKVELSK